MSEKIKKENKTSFIDWFLGSEAATSVAVVILGIIAGTIIVMCVGKNPGGLFKAIWQSFVGQYNRGLGKWSLAPLGNTLTYAIPYVLCGLSMGFANRVGMFNIGAEGQYMVGMLAAHAFAVCIPSFPGQWFFCIIVAMLAGAVWGGIVGVLKAKFKISEVVATIMLNYIALYLYRLIALYVLPEGLINKTYQTAPLANGALLQGIGIRIREGALQLGDFQLNIGFIFMLLSVLAFWYIMEKTKLGFSLRATGFNKEAARCSGINDTNAISTAMAISGAFAGIAGACVLLGSLRFGRIMQSQDNYGFMGIAVALVGNSKALGTLLAGILFGALKSAYSLMQFMSIPREVVNIIEGLIVIFIALRAGLEIVKAYRAKQLLKKEAR